MADAQSDSLFSEKAFYLAEFRGRTLAVAAPAEQLRAPAALTAVLEELAANATRSAMAAAPYSAAGSLCAKEPPTVPLLRTWRCPIRWLAR